ncbi:hypothetical protein GGR50DRAFT_42980 [Xylaria sp. CBS 124048]|nr:hypothetical protein GGR50DRAFT_42980 [Xylaria sp. CBS 124048]
MTRMGDAMRAHAIITEVTEDAVVTSAIRSARALGNTPGRPGSSSAVAMSILYSITGLITVLFLFIIITGALRAHRNPERYGPRASTNGGPRRSRARGLAMAMLATIPIIKFGESEERKPDEEVALDNVSGVVSQQHDTPDTPDIPDTHNAHNAPDTHDAHDAHAASHGTTENTANDVAPEPSTEAAKSPNPPHTEGNTPAPTDSTSQEAGPKPQSDEDNRLGCSICTEDFNRGEDVRVLPCNHKFHPACVDPWLVNVSGTCPLCRFDLRPPEDIEREENGEATTSPDGATEATDGQQAPSPGTEQAPEPNATGEAAHRRRRSRLLDWNRLRHAPVDERVQALRLYRQFLQGTDPAAGEERRHSRLTERLRERLHIRSEP